MLNDPVNYFDSTGFAPKKHRWYSNEGNGVPGGGYLSGGRGRVGDKSFLKVKKKASASPPKQVDPKKDKMPVITPTPEQQLKREPWWGKILRVFTSQYSDH